MLEFNAAAFYTAVSVIRRAQGMLGARKDEAADPFPMEALVEGSARDGMVAHVKDLDEALRTIGAKVTKMMADRIVEAGNRGDLKWGELFDMMEHLDSRLRDELTLHKLFVLEDRNVEYFEPTAPIFGAEFEEKFASVAFELDEAAKCFALGRSTAAVFHLMRIMETGSKSVSRCLNIPPPTRDAERNWGNMLKEIKDEINRRNAAKPPCWPAPEDQDFLPKPMCPWMPSASLGATQRCTSKRHTLRTLPNTFLALSRGL